VLVARDAYLDEVLKGMVRGGVGGCLLGRRNTCVRTLSFAGYNFCVR